MSSSFDSLHSMYYSSHGLINFIKRHLVKWRSSFLGFRKQLVWTGPRENALPVQQRYTEG